VLGLIDVLTFTLVTFTFGDDSMLSNAEAVISFGPLHSPVIIERLYKSQSQTSKEHLVELVEVP